MQIARVLALILFVAVALGDLTTTVSVSASGSFTGTLQGTTTADGLIATALGGSLAGGVGVTVGASVATTVTVTIGVDAGLFAGVNVAGSSGSSNGPFVSLLAGVGSSLALSVKVTANPPAQISLTLKTPAIALSGSATVQANLLAGVNDASAKGTVYGAVAYSVNTGANTITYTIPVGIATNQLFLVALDTSATASAGSSASSSNSNNANNAGSTNFNYNGKFIPVAYQTDFNLVAGLQYAYGSNIYVTPIGANASAAGTLNINYVGAFASANASSSSSASAGPSNAAAYFTGYYQISGSANANNVLQWSSDTSSSVFVNAKTGATVAAQAFANTYANSATWAKSNTAAGAQASASSWNAVTSSRGVTASGKLSVYANVNSYSQWTVQGGNAVAMKAGFLLVVVAAFAALLF